MSPKSGKAGSPVDPAAAEEAKEADNATSGQTLKTKASELKIKSANSTSAKTKPFKPPASAEEKKQKPSWIEIKLVDNDDKPVPGERYRIELPDHSVVEGTLDEKGSARVEGFEPGSCKVTFPDLDKETWKQA
jgi:hypothetical protein